MVEEIRYHVLKKVFWFFFVSEMSSELNTTNKYIAPFETYFQDVTNPT